MAEDSIEVLRLRAKAKLKLRTQQAEAEAQPKEKSFTENVISGIPMAGMVAGGMAGSALGAVAGGVGAVPGAVAGAGLGGAAGRLIEKGANKLLGYDQSESEGFVKDTAEAFETAAVGAAEGVTTEMGGPIIGKGIGMAGSAVAAAGGGLKAAAVAMKDAAGRLVGETLYRGGKAAGALGMPGIAKVLNIFSDDAAAASARALRKGQTEVTKVMQQTGKELKNTLTQANEALDPATMPVTMEVKHNVAEYVLRQAEGSPKSFYRMTQKLMDDWFIEPPNQSFDIIKTWEKAQKMDAAAQTFSRAKDAPSLSQAKVLSNMARGLRNQVDDLVAKTGDEALVSKVSTLNKDYATFKSGLKEIDVQLRSTKKKEAVQAAKDRAAQLLAAGPSKLGKYYKILEEQLGRGLSAVASRHLGLLESSDAYNELIERLNNESKQ